MASACEKYVAIDATTTRASTVIKSMPDERDTDPGVDDDAFVQHPVENVDEATVTRSPFNHQPPALSAAWAP